MSVTINLTIEGKEYVVDITKNLKRLGEFIINEIRKQIRTMKLTGDKGSAPYLQRWFSGTTSDGVRIESGVEYSTYLEFGTFAFFNSFGAKNFPKTATISKSFKKKDLPADIRKMLPKGMVPFAPVRRVINNPVIMSRLVRQAFAPNI